uniref:Uncharacterized protein n=1 Tax=Myoviridae sp. ct0f722 TaxID=2827599 RepID=A0A8S5LPI2_9CAUD|nr:MAG TPA: hypothetical protein [Myoviridae sp. ct0f722]
MSLSRFERNLSKHLGVSCDIKEKEICQVQERTQ